MHVGSRVAPSQCRHCGAEVPAGANYCLACGTGVTSTILDPLGVEDAWVPMVTSKSPGQRRGLVAVLALVVGMVVVLWTLGSDVDSPERAWRDPNTLGANADGVLTSKQLMDGPASTTAASTTTTPRTTTTTEQQYVNETPGPVLGKGIEGVLVQVSHRTLHRIDLATGAIESIDLEHTVNWGGPESEVVIEGKLVASKEWGGDTLIVTLTDLIDGSQTESSVDGEGWMRVLGQAGPDSAWVGLEAGPDGDNEVIEVGLDGKVRRRVEIPPPFWITWAEGDDLILEGIDGSYRYDTDTGEATRLSGSLLAFANGAMILASCNESLQCAGTIDLGSGPEVVDWLDMSNHSHWYYGGSINLSPDLTGALVHNDGGDWGESFQYAYVDLSTGSTRDLGEIDMEPWFGAVWVEDTSWIIGRIPEINELVAVHTGTAEQIKLELPHRIPAEAFLAFVPMGESPR